MACSPSAKSWYLFSTGPTDYSSIDQHVVTQTAFKHRGGGGSWRRFEPRNTAGALNEKVTLGQQLQLTYIYYYRIKKTIRSSISWSPCRRRRLFQLICRCAATTRARRSARRSKPSRSGVGTANLQPWVVYFFAVGFFHDLLHGSTFICCGIHHTAYFAFFFPWPHSSVAVPLCRPFFLALSDGAKSLKIIPAIVKSRSTQPSEHQKSVFG